MDLHHHKRVEIVDFLEYELISLGHINKHDFDRIVMRFHQLNKSQTGYLNEKDIMLN